MDQQTISLIISKTIFHGHSFGASPYTISHFSLPASLKKKIAIETSSFKDIIFISYWKNYDIKDLKENIMLSDEYLNIESEEIREKFLNFYIDRISLKQWKEKQAIIALGKIEFHLKKRNSPYYLLLNEFVSDESKEEIKELLPKELEFCYGILI